MGNLSDAQHDLRMRSRPDLPPTLRDRMGLYVLGRRNRLVLWRSEGRY